MGRRRHEEPGKRFGRDHWVRVVAEFEASGEPQKDFAGRHGMRLGTFQSWLYQLRRERRDRRDAPKRAAREGVRMLPVVVAQGRDERIEVSVAGGAVVRFSSGVDPKYIAALVAELTAAC
jgi:hypothetical protein